MCLDSCVFILYYIQFYHILLKILLEQYMKFCLKTQKKLSSRYRKLLLHPCKFLRRYERNFSWQICAVCYLGFLFAFGCLQIKFWKTNQSIFSFFKICPFSMFQKHFFPNSPHSCPGILQHSSWRFWDHFSQLFKFLS